MSYIAGMTMIGVGAKCITAFTASANGIQVVISNINKFSHINDVTNIIQELDLNNDIIILERLIKEININEQSTNTLRSCISTLTDCIISIEQLLNDIHTKITYNNSLWLFKSFRAYTFNNDIKQLEIFKKVFENRKKMLFSVMDINSKLVRNNDEIVDLSTKIYAFD